MANECRLSDLEARPIGTWLSERKDTALRKVNLDSNCFTAQGILPLVYVAGEGHVKDLSLDGNEYLWFEGSNVSSFSCASQAHDIARETWFNKRWRERSQPITLHVGPHWDENHTERFKSYLPQGSQVFGGKDGGTFRDDEPLNLRDLHKAIHSSPGQDD